MNKYKGNIKYLYDKYKEILQIKLTGSYTNNTQCNTQTTKRNKNSNSHTHTEKRGIENTNKERNNQNDLINYHNNADELNKKRSINRMIAQNASCKLHYCLRCGTIFRRIIDLKSHRTNDHTI